MSLLLCSTKWSYPLHTLLSEADLHSLLRSSTFSLSPSDSSLVGVSLELQRGMLQNLFCALLFYGEVWPCTNFTRILKTSEPASDRSVAMKIGKSNSGLSCSKDSVKDSKYSPTKVESIPYNTFIISNTLEFRKRTTPESVAELHLQKVARAIYGSVLLALVHAKPLNPSRASEDRELDHEVDVDEVSILKDQFIQGLESSDVHVFPETLSMLIRSIEELLKQATAHHQLLNETDIIAVLSLWHKCNAVLSKEQEPLVPSTKKKLDKKSVDQHVIYLVTSESCFYTLVDFLLTQTFLSPAVWQAGLVCILGNLRSKLVIGYEKVLELLVKFFQCSPSTVDPGLAQKLTAAVLPLNLHSSSRGATLSGGCVLLDVLITVLHNRYAFFFFFFFFL